jgi:hypothetical protein
MTANWTVDPSPACGALGFRTIDEVRRACAAARTCELGSSDAARRAVLTCNRDEMIVDGVAPDGQRLWSLVLTGTPADRARQAAVWIARSDDLEVAPPPPPPPAPPAPPPRQEEPIAPKRAPATSGGLTGALVAIEMPSHFSPLANAAGLQLGAGFALGRGFYAGPILMFAQATQVSRNLASSVLLLHGGARVGWGAPWSDGVLGAYLDAGAGFWSVAGEEGSQLRLAAPYVAPTVVVQYPRAPLRPYLGLSGVVLDGQTGIYGGAALAAGVAWSAW